ncbi:MAG: T9SS type A sorting domain-containing protein [Bacteroidales bacterium]
MKFSFFRNILIAMFFLFALNVNAQFVPKKAGLCFRVDDNHSIQKFQEYSSVFDNYGFKMCFALNLGQVNPSDSNFLKCIDTLVAHGHELMDHTPNHHTNYFTVKNFVDTIPYSFNSAIDHINQTKICLKVDSIHTNSFNNEGNVVLNGNRLISTLPGEFKNFLTEPNPVQCIYLPTINKLCSYYNLSNLNINDPDTIYLKTFWEEPFTTNFTGTTIYKKVGMLDVFMNRTAIFYLMNTTRKYCNDFNLPLPTAWIQPGGYFPRYSVQDIKTACDLNGYTTAALVPNPALRCFNEFNPFKTKNLNFQGYDFYSEIQTFKSIKTLIADGIARNFIQLDNGHMGDYSVNPLLGGWNGYIQRMDSILSWCAQNNIPVKLYKQWVPILYDSISDPYQNVFPSLSRDIDTDGFPDGYNKSYIGNINTSGGVPSSSGYYLSRTLWGHLCMISNLGGVEKGKNILEFYTKGNPNDSINLKITFNQSGLDKYFYIKTNTISWQKQKVEFICPDSISTIQIDFLANISYPNIKLSGISLRKKSELSVSQDTTIYAAVGCKFKNLDLKTKVIDPFFSPDNLNYSVIQASKLTAFINPSKKLIVNKPTPFWQGEDTIWVKIENPDESKDTLKIIYKTSLAEICKGDTIMLTPDFSVEPLQLMMTSFPYDSSLMYKSAGTFTATPKHTTRYYVEGMMPTGNIISDTIIVYIQLMPWPVLTITGSNPHCFSDSVKIDVTPDYYKTSWFRNDTLVSGNDTLSSYQTTLPGDYYAIQTNQNKCKNISSIITVYQYPQIQFGINTDTIVCSNIDSLRLNAQISNTDTVVWSTSGDGWISYLPNQHLTYHPGVSDRFNASTTLKVFVRGLGNCSIKQDSIRIYYAALPTRPNIPLGPDTLCVNSPNSVYAATGSIHSDSYQWSISPASAGTINSYLSYAEVDWNDNYNGKVFISVKGINQCGMSDFSDSLSVEILPSPSKPELIADTFVFCQNSINQFFSVKTSMNAVSYQWSIIPANAANLTGNDTIVSVDWNNNFNGSASIIVQGINSCGLSPVSDAINIILDPLPLKPSLPIGQTFLCINNSNSFYTTQGSNLASAYQWNLYPSSAGILNDSATNAFVDWDSSFVGAAKIIVNAINNCGNTSSDTLFIEIDPIPLKPVIPSGFDMLCENSINTLYSISADPYASFYSWSIYPTTAANIISTDTLAIADWNPNFSGIAHISVKGFNNCGLGIASDSLMIIVNSHPSNPTIMSGPVYVLTDTAMFSNYSANSNYSDSIIWWIEPSTSAILNAYNSVCTAYWTPSFSGTAQLKLKGLNSCGYSDTITVFNINVLSPVSSHNYETVNFSVFPNPSVNGKFIIQFNQRQILKNILVKITDQLGRNIYEKDLRPTEFSGKSIEADISAFSKGIYFLSVGEKTRKIIFE